MKYCAENIKNFTRLSVSKILLRCLFSIVYAYKLIAYNKLKIIRIVNENCLRINLYRNKFKWKYSFELLKMFV